MLLFSWGYGGPALSGEAPWQSFPVRENGTLPVWLVAGPFPNGIPLAHGPGCFGYYHDFLEPLGGEEKTCPAEGDSIALEEGDDLLWRSAFSQPEGLVDFLTVLETDSKSPGVAYSFCRIDSPARREAVLLARSNDGVRIWLNGELVHDHHVGRTIDEGDEDRVEIVLLPGPNDLMVKVDQSMGGWAQKIVVADREGRPLNDLAVAIQSSNEMPGRIISAEFFASPLVLKSAEGPQQVVMAHLSSGGVEGLACEIDLEGKRDPLQLDLGDLPLGEHRVALQVPAGEGDRLARFALRWSKGNLDCGETLLKAPREWTLYMVQHTHTDIGYTRPQDEILPNFLRQIDYALDYCDLTDNYPEEARFRWTCEVTWPVREYLKRRPPEQVERLRRRVEEGRIEIAGMFLNFDELADENTLAASLRPIEDLKRIGLPVKTAIQNDVPGVAWALVDYYADLGVDYLIMGINNDRTPRPFDRPTAFWWESASGKRILAWRPDHYHTGNHLRLHQPDLRPVEEKTMAYLQSLEEAGYPFDRIGLQYSGTQIDNSPPAMEECDLIRRWNEKFLWPKMRSATAREFLDFVAEEHSEALPVYRGAWPNWWTDGYAFAHVETKEARKAHVDLLVDEALLSMASLLGATIPAAVHPEIADIEDDLLFYDEHTFGAQEEFTRPTASNSVRQYGMKVSHVWEAAKNTALLKETAWGLLQERVPKSASPTVHVFNTLPWKRSGWVDVYIGHEILPKDRAFMLTESSSGKAVPIELLWSRFEGTYWRMWVEGVPPLGYMTLSLVVGDVAPSEVEKQPAGETVLENEFYRVEIDPASGAIASWYDKHLDREMVDREAPYRFGEFIYDRLVDAHFYSRESFLARSTRSGLRNVRISGVLEGPLWKSLTLSGDAEGCLNSPEAPGLECEVRLYHGDKRIELLYRMRKAYVNQPESVYIAFPFAFPQGHFVYEAQGGVVQPGVDQLPGSSSDWHTVQNFVAARGDKAQAVLISDEVPLVQFGDINLGKWQSVARVEKTHLYSWVVNNYWTSGFPGNKESEFTWSYHLTSSDEPSDESATRFGWASRTPLQALVLPGGKPSDGIPAMAALEIRNSNVLLVNIEPVEGETAIQLHLREVAGKMAEVEADWPEGVSPRIDRINVLGESIEENVDKMRLEPYEARFYRVSF
jgi:hypothetical protein